MERFSPSTFTRVLGIELRSAGLKDNCLYLMNHLPSPGTLGPPASVRALPGTLGVWFGFVCFIWFERTRD